MLEDKILEDYKAAMKSKDNLKSSVLSFLRAEMINAAFAKKKKSLEDDEVITVIRKQVKQHQDSIEQFKKGNRLDLADKEAGELEILKSYLPKELAVEEIKKIIDEAVSATAAQTMKDMGKVMKQVKEKICGRADNKLVSDLVKEKLSKPQGEPKAE
ncbi:MAG: GatB/YqeY domain-containing protein [Candidatus Omnitrophota bacterium]|nr:MAG: GatB/YqeY domain-containing protein [Candidatus Omnitrophota bacterium]